MSLDPLNRYSRAEIAAGARHFERAVSGVPGLGRKAIARAERGEAEAAEVASDARVVTALDRHAGALAATRTLAPARAVQGRGPVLESEGERRTYTPADVEALCARIADDEADTAAPSVHLTRIPASPRSASQTQAVVRDWAEACLAEGSPEARKAGQILAARHGIKLETR